jgi:hypothetical protein
MRLNAAWVHGDFLFLSKGRVLILAKGSCGLGGNAENAPDPRCQNILGMNVLILRIWDRETQIRKRMVSYAIK